MKINRLFFYLTGALVFCVNFLVYAEEVVPDVFNNKEAPQEIYFSDLFRSRSKESYTGVILANILHVDPAYRYVFIKPREGRLPRITVYLDKYTGFTKMKVGKFSRGNKKQMLEGDRVAIRLFVREGVVLADEVYLVEGEFGSKARYAKRKFTGPVGKPGGSAAGSSGSHGASAPAKKSSGGH